MIIKWLQKLYKNISNHVSCDAKEKIRLPYIEVSITEHCNLDCKGCSHFSNVADEIFMQIDSFINDMNELSKKFDIDTIRLLGGEPLLHKNINDFMINARKYFPQTTIHIVTNGILLPQKDELFWETTVKNNIVIDISQYPINKEIYEKSYNLIKKYDLKHRIKVTDYFCFFFNPKASYNKNNAFKYCKCRGCLMLKNGKLYHCSVGSCINHYNNYFKTRLKGEKGIDIYKNSAGKIVKYMEKPIISCKYCSWEKAKFVRWSFSEKRADEWNYLLT